jgi:hypothetical protein
MMTKTQTYQAQNLNFCLLWWTRRLDDSRRSFLFFNLTKYVEPNSGEGWCVASSPSTVQQLYRLQTHMELGGSNLKRLKITNRNSENHQNPTEVHRSAY